LKVIVRGGEGECYVTSVCWAKQGEVRRV